MPYSMEINNIRFRRKHNLLTNRVIKLLHEIKLISLAVICDQTQSEKNLLDLNTVQDCSVNNHSFSRISKFQKFYERNNFYKILNI